MEIVKAPQGRCIVTNHPYCEFWGGKREPPKTVEKTTYFIYSVDLIGIPIKVVLLCGFKLFICIIISCSVIGVKNRTCGMLGSEVLSMSFEGITEAILTPTSAKYSISALLMLKEFDC